MPPLLEEAGKKLRRASGGEAASSSDLTDDELACLLDCSPNNGAGCSVACGLEAEAAAARGGAQAGGQPGWGGDSRALALVLTLCPPLALAASNPDNFLGALEVRRAAGAALLCCRAGWPAWAGQGRWRA